MLYRNCFSLVLLNSHKLHNWPFSGKSSLLRKYLILIIWLGKIVQNSLHKLISVSSTKSNTVQLEKYLKNNNLIWIWYKLHVWHLNQNKTMSHNSVHFGLTSCPCIHVERLLPVVLCSKVVPTNKIDLKTPKKH